MNLIKIKNEWFSNIKGDVLAGITVAIALIPEAISFSIICGVDPMLGLYASFCIAVIIAFSGGRPAMISAATGSMALVMVSLVKTHGIEYMFAATILTGIIQFILGKLKVGKLIDFISHSVILGFVNALAILIFLAQIPNFKGVSWIMYAFVIGTLAIIYLFPRITKAVPSPLVAIIVMTVAAVLLKADLKTVGDMGTVTRSLPMFHFPNIPFTRETLYIIFPYAVTLSVVGLMESLLTATIIDDMTNTKSDKNREVKGQGFANVVAGFFGGMAGCAMIGQSVINIKSGGKTRLSTLISGLFLMVLILFLNDVVKIIPMAALVGVMIMVSISTFEWKSITQIKKTPIPDAIVMIATMVIVVITDNLAIGVIAGIVISTTTFAWKITEIKVKEHLVEHDGCPYKVYRLSGQIFFASTANLADKFNYIEDPNDIIIDFKNSHIWDHSAVVAVSKIKEKYQNVGKSVHVVGLNKDSNSIVNKVDDTIFNID